MIDSTRRVLAVTVALTAVFVGSALALEGLGGEPLDVTRAAASSSAIT